MTGLRELLAQARTERDLLDCFAISGSCCGSCVEDEDYGYPMPWVEIGDREIGVCCKHVNEVNEALERVAAIEGTK